MPQLIVLEGDMKDRTFSIRGETIFIGRSLKNDIQIQDGAISRKQLKIFRIGKKFFIEDLKSTNGTMLNGEQIPPGEGFEVDEGDSISIGSTVLQLTNFPPRKPLELAHLSKRPSDADKAGPSNAERRSPSSGNLDLILKVSELVKDSWEIKDLLNKTLDYIMEALPRIHRASIILFAHVDKGGGKEIKQVLNRTREEETAAGQAYSRSVVERVLRDGKAIRMSNTSFENITATKDHDETLQIGSILCVPLISNAQMRGAIYVDTIRKPYGFRKDDLLLLNGLSGTLALAIEKASK